MWCVTAAPGTRPARLKPGRRQATTTQTQTTATMAAARGRAAQPSRWRPSAVPARMHPIITGAAATSSWPQRHTRASCSRAEPAHGPAVPSRCPSSTKTSKPLRAPPKPEVSHSLAFWISSCQVSLAAIQTTCGGLCGVCKTEYVCGVSSQRGEGMQIIGSTYDNRLCGECRSERHDGGGAMQRSGRKCSSSGGTLEHSCHFKSRGATHPDRQRSRPR